MCYSELDRTGTGDVNFEEFSWWWFKTKYGVPRSSSGSRCPESFLTALAGHLRPEMFSPGERLVKPAEYGQHFVILLGGKLRILRPGVRPGLPGSHPNDENRNVTRDRSIVPEDRAPAFGFSACLTKAQYDLVSNRTDYWAVDAEAYCDTVWCPRKCFYECFTDHWLKGREDMVEMAYFHYEVELILNSQMAIDHDNDGVVSHEEFQEASAKIPHGFAKHYAECKKGAIDAANGREHVAIGTLDASILGRQIQVEDDHNATAESLMESRELLVLKVAQLDKVAHQLASDVSAMKQGMRRLLSHHNEAWVEEEARDTSECFFRIDPCPICVLAILTVSTSRHSA